MKKDVGVPKITTNAYFMELACYFYCVLMCGCGYVHATQFMWWESQDNLRELVLFCHRPTGLAASGLCNSGAI